MQLFEQLKNALAPTEDTAQRDPAYAQRIAAAVLMLEIAHADNIHADVEYQTIRSELKRCFDLDSAAVEELLSAAQPEADAAASLYDFFKILNGGLDANEKREVIEMLWQVAYADQEIAADEEALLRRIADLLYLSHSDFIRAKLAVLGE